jgi:hypothetical protein
VILKPCPLIVHAQELFNDPPRTNIYVGDQSDREGWARFRRQMAEKGVSFDVILDDGATLSLEQWRSLPSCSTL